MKKMLNTADAVRSWENRHAKKGGRPLRCCAIDASADSEDTEEGWAFLNTGLSCCICSRYSFSLPDTVAHAVGLWQPLRARVAGARGRAGSSTWTYMVWGER